MADIFQTNETTDETNDTAPPRVPVTKETQSPPRVQKSVPPSSQPPPRVPTKATVSPHKDPQPNPPTHQYGTRTATQKATNKPMLQPLYKARALNHILTRERVYQVPRNAQCRNRPADGNPNGIQGPHERPVLATHLDKSNGK
eukprot:scaffold221282_cov58-Attheya_sp.AAC.1